ncbi:unnamed protein product, partial [Laminaria digitata]
MRELYNFTVGKEGNPVERLYAIEDLREKLVNAGMSVEDNTLYSCFVNALPAAEYALERRDLNLKQAYDKKEILNPVRSQYNTLLPTFGKSKGSSQTLMHSSEKGGEAMVVEVVGGGRSGKGKEGGNSNKNAGARTSKVTCFRCRATGHYSSKCTTQI